MNQTVGRSDIGATCFNCVLWSVLASSPQKSYRHLLLYFYSPTGSCLSVTLYFNDITVRLAYAEHFVCGFLCRNHAHKLFSTGIFLLLFYSLNLCISRITSAKYEKNHNGMSMYVQHTLIHIIYKIQNCCFSPDGSSLKILILHPRASKGKQYH